MGTSSLRSGMIMVLIDTSAWIEALRVDGDSGIRQRVAALLKAGQVVLCDMVILELWNGARGERERAELRSIIDVLTKVPISRGVWSRASSLAVQCRAIGVTVPATDLLIAATARFHGIDLLESDRHFRMIPDEDLSSELSS